MSNKTLLVITDGIGHKPKTKCNAFHQANKSTYPRLFNEAAVSMIRTHGLSVGLPEGQMGNSEVGHMTIGAGRVLYQDLVRITMALEDGSIKQNEALQGVLAKTKRIHLLGLMSDGGVHSHINHILGLAKILSGEGCEVFLHFVSDGRDVSPTSSPEYIEQVEQAVDSNISLATIGGRFYAMDRDNRWERVEKAFRAIVEAEPKTDQSPKAYVQFMYDQKITDEFIEPVAFGGYNGMQDGDGVIMVNFRSDRAREISRAIGDKEFAEFEKKPLDLHVVTMTEYDKHFTFPVMFRKENIQDTLAETVSKAGLSQLHTSETEKYAHVTFFLNGGREEPFVNEQRALVPSPKVKTYDMQPEMSAKEVGDAVLKGMGEGIDFIVVNFANGDMVGHTGVVEAGIKAVEAVDAELGRILDALKEHDYNLIITSDHGNCEEMCDGAGHTLTNHTVGDVWCFVVADGVTDIQDGGLNNIAPTVLKLLDIPAPESMDAPLF